MPCPDLKQPLIGVLCFIFGEEDSMQKTVLLLIHGIWRLPFKKNWQDDVVRVHKEMGLQDKIIIERVNYPFVPAVASWLSTFSPFIFNLLSRPFTRKIEKLFEFYAAHPKAAIAHSYGSWLIWQKMLSDHSVKFETMIFAGSPCPHTVFPLRLHLLMDAQVKRWHNFANFHDEVAGMYSPFPYGDLGQIGLQSEDWKRVRVEHPIEGRSFWNHYVDDAANQKEHGEYFSAENIRLMMEKVVAP